ncbi:MAG TPA: AI-2E family transporter [Burkholderiales bacterium]|nr:AI-2E family transporter [Burkholderiales bacterium]
MPLPSESSKPPLTPPILRPRSPRVVFFVLIALLLGVLALVVLVFRPFLITLALAAALALLLRPLHLRVTRLLRGRAGASAFALVALVAVMILVPVTGIVATIAAQSLNFYQWLLPRLNARAMESLWTEHLPAQIPWIGSLQSSDGRILDFLTRALVTLAGAANNFLQAAVRGLSSAAFETVLLLIMLYFFLRDGPYFREELRKISPLTESQAGDLLDKVAKTMEGSLTSLLVVPLVQGVLATLGYLVLGVPNALMWGGITTLVAFVPAVGTPLAWIPICIYLALAGQVWQSVVLAIYCTLVVASIDNFIRPWFLKGAASIHPLWSFLAVLGGLISFGPLGLLMGPLVLSLGVSALRIYEMDVLRPARSPQLGLADAIPPHQRLDRNTVD